MNYPLRLTFKILAFSPQIYVRDASGAEICYVKQRLFKLKESIRVFTDSSMNSLLTEITANKILDFSATYTFTDAQGQPYGAVRRKGLRSLWRTHYEILENGAHTFTIRERNPWSKFFDGLFGEIPIIGVLSGYVFHPQFDVLDQQNRVCFRLHKRRAFLEGRFELEKKADVQSDITVLMALLMMALLERSRG